MSSTLRSWLLFARRTNLRTEANTRSFASSLSSRNVGESNTRRSATKSHNNALEVVRNIVSGLVKKVYSLYDIATARCASYSTRVPQEDSLPAQAGAARPSEQRHREAALLGAQPSQWREWRH